MLIGEQNGASITADEVAAWADTIAYEILARIHHRFRVDSVRVLSVRLVCLDHLDMLNRSRPPK